MTNAHNCPDNQKTECCEVRVEAALAVQGSAGDEYHQYPHSYTKVHRRSASTRTLVILTACGGHARVDLVDFQVLISNCRNELDGPSAALENPIISVDLISINVDDAEQRPLMVPSLPLLVKSNATINPARLRRTRTVTLS